MSILIHVVDDHYGRKPLGVFLIVMRHPPVHEKGERYADSGTQDGNEQTFPVKLSFGFLFHGYKDTNDSFMPYPSIYSYLRFVNPLP